MGSYDLSIKWRDGRDRRTGGSTVAVGACPGHRGHQSNHGVADAAGRRLSDTRFGVSGAGLLVGKRAYGLEGHTERGQALGAAFKAPAAREAASVAETGGRPDLERLGRTRGPADCTDFNDAGRRGGLEIARTQARRTGRVPKPVGLRLLVRLQITFL